MPDRPGVPRLWRSVLSQRRLSRGRSVAGSPGGRPAVAPPAKEIPKRTGFMSAGRPAMRDRRYVCMVFDEETGNAIDAFDYTEEALAGRLRQLRGEPKVTMQPNPWASLSPRREARDE